MSKTFLSKSTDKYCQVDSVIWRKRTITVEVVFLFSFYHWIISMVNMNLPTRLTLILSVLTMVSYTASEAWHMYIPSSDLCMLTIVRDSVAMLPPENRELLFIFSALPSLYHCILDAVPCVTLQWSVIVVFWIGWYCVILAYIAIGSTNKKS